MIVKYGQVTVTESDVIVSGFAFRGPGTGREALQWAIDRIRDEQIRDLAFSIETLEDQVDELQEAIK